jgi:hypothetical protein
VHHPPGGAHVPATARRALDRGSRPGQSPVHPSYVPCEPFGLAVTARSLRLACAGGPGPGRARSTPATFLASPSGSPSLRARCGSLAPVVPRARRRRARTPAPRACGSLPAHRRPLAVGVRERGEAAPAPQSARLCLAARSARPACCRGPGGGVPKARQQPPAVGMAGCAAT